MIIAYLMDAMYCIKKYLSLFVAQNFWNNVSVFDNGYQKLEIYSQWKLVEEIFIITLKYRNLNSL